MGYIEKGRAKTLTKIILWLVVISFVATIFVTWGAQRSDLGVGTSTALRVGGIDITPDDMNYYGNFYRYVRDRIHFRFISSLYMLMTQQMPSADFGLEGETLAWYVASTALGGSLAGSAMQYAGSSSGVRQMIQGVLQMVGDLVLAQRAQAAGMRVSEEEMSALLSVVYTDPDGNFLGEEEVQSDLDYYRIGSNDAKFTDSLRRHLLALRYADHLYATIEPELENDLLDAYKAESIQAQIYFASFVAADYIASLEYTQADLQAYLADNAGEFVIADMLLINREAYIDEIDDEITDEQIRARYNENSEDYRLAERRDFRRILIEIPEDATDEQRTEAEATIAEIYERLARPGEEFATVARDYSADPSAASEDIVIENQAKDEIADPALANAVFDLEQPGGFNTEAVETGAGLEIVQLVQIHTAGLTPLEEVSDDIRLELAEERANDETRSKADELHTAAGTGEWGALAEPGYIEYRPEVIIIEGENQVFSSGIGEGGIGLEEIGFVNRIDELFDLEEGSMSQVKSMSTNYVFFRISAKGDSLQGRFDFLRPAVRRQYTMIRSREKAEQEAEKLASSAAGAITSEEFNQLAEAAGATPEERLTSRWGVMEFGNDMANEIFSAQTPAVIGPHGTEGSYHVALVTDITPFDEETFNRRKNELRLRMLASWVQGQPVFLPGRALGDSFTRLFDAQLSYLITSTEVRLNREIFSAMFGGGSTGQ